jgi:hypothetical protein
MLPITREQTTEALQKQAFLGNWIRSMRLKPEQVSQGVRDSVSVADKVMGGAKKVSVKTPSAYSHMTFSEAVPPLPQLVTGLRPADWFLKNFVAGPMTLPRDGGLPDIASSARVYMPQGIVSRAITGWFGKRPVLAHEAMEAISAAEGKAILGPNAFMNVYSGYRLPKLPDFLAKRIANTGIGRQFDDVVNSGFRTSQGPFLARGNDGKLIYGSQVGAHYHPSVYAAEALGAQGPFQKLRTQMLRSLTGEGNLVKATLKNPQYMTDISLTPSQALNRAGIRNDVVSYPGRIETLVNTRTGWFS